MSNKTLKKLIGVHECSGDTDKQYALELQNQLIFYLRVSFGIFMGLGL